MSSLAVDQRVDVFASLRPLLMSRWMWCLAAALFVVMRDIGSAQLLTSLGDTDDATRLVQVREWLATGSWYDVLLPRFGGPTPLLSHWSRLIDLPIGVLLVIFGAVLSAENAELATRIVWPSLLLVVFLRLLVREAEARAGAFAGVFVIALAITAMTGLYQFKPGRIDHHNVMIMCTLIGFLSLARALTSARSGYSAGVCLGLALVVGYEPLMLIMPAVAGLVLLAALRPVYLTSTRNVVIGLASTLAAGLLATLPPWLWHTSPCDALGANMVLLATVGAIGLSFVAARGQAWSPAVRLSVLAAYGAVGVGAFFATNTTCLRGPFGLMSQEAIDLWLVTVLEGKSVFETLPYQTVSVTVYLLFAALALLFAGLHYRRERSSDAAAMLALLGLTLAASLLTVKLVPYGSFLAAFAIALFVAGLSGGGQLTPLSARLLGAISLNQSTLTVLIGLALASGGTSKAAMPGSAMSGATITDTDQCRTTQVMQSLAKLPKGFVVANVDFGPYIVALTRHDVLSAPYHRIDGAIVESIRILRASPEIAEQKLRALDADYVVACVLDTQPGGPPRLEDGVTRDSLIGRLSHGERVAFLEQLKGISAEPAFRVWRVKRRDE
jgi:hypothetical protein